MKYDGWIAFAAVVTSYVRWFTFAEIEQITNYRRSPNKFLLFVCLVYLLESDAFLASALNHAPQPYGPVPGREGGARIARQQPPTTPTPIPTSLPTVTGTELGFLTLT